MEENASVFEYAYYGSINSENDRFHPTQKPVALYAWTIKNYCQPGWKILDTHGGSFSSAIAAEKLGFDMVICEIDKDYYRDGVARFKKETDLGLLASAFQSQTSNLKPQTELWH